jgi:hypothetical protein
VGDNFAWYETILRRTLEATKSAWRLFTLVKWFVLERTMHIDSGEGGVTPCIVATESREGDLMGFMDKVKEQAASAASAAKDAAAKGQAKVGEMQAKRGADGVLRQLGLAAYLQTQNRAPATTEADIEKYIETLKAYEAENGELSASEDTSN